MRFVFVDEAGTSANEPVTVVVGIVADADNHVMNGEALVHEILGGVPPKHRKGFVFHATQVFGDKKYQDGWSMTDRLHLLKSMMMVPQRVGMAVSIGVVWRSSGQFAELAKEIRISESQYDHLMAFMYCISAADSGIQNNAGPREVASIVAEDERDMRRVLKLVPRLLRDSPMHLSPEMMRETERDKAAGYSTQTGGIRVTRIRNSVNFVEKHEDPLVQVADACAYGFRRYFAGEKFGSDFVDAILGDHKLVRHFGPPAGFSCWWKHR